MIGFLEIIEIKTEMKKLRQEVKEVKKELQDIRGILEQENVIETEEISEKLLERLRKAIIQ